ncbi:MAG: cytochrome C biosynthesis protein [Sphingomonadales bacterium]|nr:MAG: cytochrome C biosynthesis protein [Sphingomonadales bacterium]TNF02122.1 MAG: cytochrome C biosynthesis protein [Sphingomonadales bacterium]
MSWVIVALLLACIVAGLTLLGRLPRSLWELTGAALLLGIAGYAWQGSPGLAGAPRAAADTAPRFDEDLAKLRNSFGGQYGQTAQWLTLSDGLARQGKTREAVNVIASGLRAQPDDVALWVAMGNALVLHGDGFISPSAEYSYNQAMHLAPQSSAAPFFYGLALAQSGQYGPARKIWGALKDRVPEQSPLHAELEAYLARLDRILAGQQGMGQ